MNKSKRIILVTGGLGYIGSHTVVELKKEGYEVVIVDNLANSSKDVLERISSITSSQPGFYEVDLRDKKNLEKVFKKHDFDAVIHFAGYKAAGESTEIPLDYYENNLLSSIVLLELMKEHEVKNLIFSSSAAVYGSIHIPPYRETMDIDFSVNPYGRTKAFIEYIIEDYGAADSSFSSVMLRYFNPVGAEKEGRLGEFSGNSPTNLMPLIIKAASGEMDRLEVYGDDYPTVDGTGVRDYLHVVDLARGHVAALRYIFENKGLEIFNLGSGKGTSVLEMIREFERVNKVKVPYQIKDRRPGDSAVSFASPEKAKRKLGWQTVYTLEDMCIDSWNWYVKSNGKL